MLNWPPSHVQKILDMEPEVFWDPMEHKLLEELRTVKDCRTTLSKLVQVAVTDLPREYMLQLADTNS